MSRENQRHRTRKDLLEAAARLLRTGRVPDMDEVAAEAKVSRATAYRYFPRIEALLLEAPLDAAVPDPRSLFEEDASTDPAERAVRAEAALHDMCVSSEIQLRIMLAQAVTRPSEPDAPRRQNRRTPLIEAALAPARERMAPADYRRLCRALALVFGTESLIVFRDVVPLADAEAREVKRWAIRTLIDAALVSHRPPSEATKTGAVTPPAYSGSR